MITFKIIYEQDGKRGETMVEHWTKGAAQEIFESQHPLATIIEIYED